MNLKTKLYLVAGTMTVLLLVGLFLAAPYIALHNMKSALERGDADALSEYINFPAVKGSIRAAVNAKLAQTVAAKGNDPFAAAGTAFATMMIGPMVDALVTPEALAAMMQGSGPDLNGDQKQGLQRARQDRDMDDGIDTSMGYESLDRFSVTIRKKGSREKPLDMVLRRNGMFSWRLSAVRIPL